MGHQPNGTAVQMRSIDIWRVKDGKLIEHWDEHGCFDFSILVHS
jgi:predicted SnoaL-like aldol condensation-catalyzing enzyme